MGPASKRHRMRRLAERLATGALAIGLVAAVIVWFVFHHKPAWYRPVSLDAEGRQRARAGAVNTADYVGDRLVERKPFDVVLRDEEVTAWLAALTAADRGANGKWPKEIEDVAVRFEQGIIRIGVHYKSRHWQSILSVELDVDIVDDGEALRLGAVKVRGGSLLLPRALLDRIVDQRWLARLGGKDFGLAADEATGRHRRNGATLDDFLRGARVENRFVWFNGRRPFQIASIDAHDGELRLRIVPK